MGQHQNIGEVAHSFNGLSGGINPFERLLCQIGAAINRLSFALNQYDGIGYVDPVGKTEPAVGTRLENAL
jgi:hypothetical protein